jgi:hypothetical protein
MIKLEIFNPDKSLYWTEHFKSEKQLNAWLDEEKTRPYWNKEFTTVITDNRPSAADELQRQLEIEERQDRARSAARDFKALEVNNLRTIDDIKQAIALIKNIFA